MIEDYVSWIRSVFRNSILYHRVIYYPKSKAIKCSRMWKICNAIYIRDENLRKYTHTQKLLRQATYIFSCIEMSQNKVFCRIKSVQIKFIGLQHMAIIVLLL